MFGINSCIFRLERVVGLALIDLGMMTDPIYIDFHLVVQLLMARICSPILYRVADY